jgi:flagellar operon protein
MSNIKTVGSNPATGLTNISNDKLGNIKNAPKNSEGLDFRATLDQQIDKAEKMDVKPKSTKPILQFSNHALERMSRRQIHFTPEQITKIEQAMQKAADKGAKETLVLTDESALIVNLKDNKVVTVMDKAMLKENVFTNIDSTVFV